MEQSIQKKRGEISRPALLGFVTTLLFFPFAAKAQTTLNATGGTAKISGNTFSYSIGEMVLISTASASNHYFTQGLLQNDDVNLKVYDNPFLSEGLELYPNPTANILYLQPSFPGGGKLSLQLYDLRGRLVMNQKIELLSGMEKQHIDLSMLQEGTYLLQASLEKEGRVYRHSFKIVKFSDQ